MLKLVVLAALASSLATASFAADLNTTYAGSSAPLTVTLGGYPCDHYFHLDRYGRCVSDYRQRAAMSYGKPFYGDQYRGYARYDAYRRDWR